MDMGNFKLIVENGLLNHDTARQLYGFAAWAYRRTGKDKEVSLALLMDEYFVKSYGGFLTNEPLEVFYLDQWRPGRYAHENYVYIEYENKNLYEQVLPHQIRRPLKRWEPKHGEHIEYFDEMTGEWANCTMDHFDEDRKKYFVYAQKRVEDSDYISWVYHYVDYKHLRRKWSQK